MPNKSHEDYAGLPASNRRTVRILASILRVAESLDRSHAQTISGIEVRDRGEDFLLLVHTSDDAELEVWAAERHLEPFEQTLGKPLRLEAATAPSSVRQGFGTQDSRDEPSLLPTRPAGNIPH